MTLKDILNIHTTRNSCRGGLLCANMELKLHQYFYLLTEKPLGRYFQVRSPYYQVAQWNQKIPIPISSRWQVRSERAKKGQASTLITATNRVHFPKPASTDWEHQSTLGFRRVKELFDFLTWNSQPSTIICFYSGQVWFKQTSNASKT